tara:strand:- start:2992 stop:4539 length:1548 start_codon:yes stop_codon:yes gene_type:complete
MNVTECVEFNMTEKLILGPPGCGKTYTLINIVKKELQSGTAPERIGFVSFSKKAIEEAKARTTAELGLIDRDVPWFRTLHSTGFQWMGMKAEEVVSRYDFRKIGLMLGMAFNNNTAASLADGILPASVQEGNKYLEMIGRATLRMISLEEQYNDAGNYDLSWPMLKKVDEIYTLYKVDNNKYDYTDMIRLFVEQGTAPTLDVLIVDEAQDLTPLQWKQVEVLKQSADRVWYAGDDDQAIHRWMGVRVEQFMEACDEVEILKQSHRVPSSIHLLANRIVNRIETRFEKQWSPTEREGNIDFYSSWYDVNIDHGSWTIMARTNKIISTVAEDLRESGYFFERYGVPSISPDYMKGIDTWNTLVDGVSISLSDAHALYRIVPKQGENAVIKRGSAKTLEYVDPDSMLSYEDLVEHHGLIAPKSRHANSIVNMSLDDQRYMLALIKRGEDISKPRIKLSTIHAMKGGEDDNIMLFTESAYPCVNSKFPDDEHRIFYTGITRTKENLHIIETGAKYRYEI